MSCPYLSRQGRWSSRVYRLGVGVGVRVGGFGGADGTRVGVGVGVVPVHSLVEGLPQGDGAVFRRVVVVYVEVALARQLQVQVPVLGHRVQHVVQEPEAGVHLNLELIHPSTKNVRILIGLLLLLVVAVVYHDIVFEGAAVYVSNRRPDISPATLTMTYCTDPYNRKPVYGFVAIKSHTMGRKTRKTND